MRFVQFCLRKSGSSAPRLGVELAENGDVVDLVQLPVKNTMDLIKAGPEMVEKAKK